MSARQQYAFVLGTGRCGSTLVQEVLARHPDIGFVTNLDDRFGVLSRRRHVDAYRRLPHQLTQKGRVRFAPSEAYRALEREASPVLADPFRDLRGDDLTPWLADRLTGFFSRRADVQGLPLFLHKFTGWPRALLLDAALPGSRFVHVVRDGRAVANSWLQMPWWRGHRGPAGWHFGPLSAQDEQAWAASGRSLPVLAGLAWRLLMSSYDECARQLGPDRWLELRYEDVVRDPDAAFRSMTSFLGLPWRADFADAVAAMPFSGARGEAFRRDLGQRHVADLDAVLADALARRGYA